MKRNFIMTYPQYIDAVRAFVSSERYQPSTGRGANEKGV